MFLIMTDLNGSLLTKMCNLADIGLYVIIIFSLAGGVWPNSYPHDL